MKNLEITEVGIAWPKNHDCRRWKTIRELISEGELQKWQLLKRLETNRFYHVWFDVFKRRILHVVSFLLDINYPLYELAYYGSKKWVCGESFYSTIIFIYSSPDFRSYYNAIDTLWPKMNMVSAVNWLFWYKTVSR